MQINIRYITVDITSRHQNKVNINESQHGVPTVFFFRKVNIRSGMGNIRPAGHIWPAKQKVFARDVLNICI